VKFARSFVLAAPSNVMSKYDHDDSPCSDGGRQVLRAMMRAHLGLRSRASCDDAFDVEDSAEHAAPPAMPADEMRGYFADVERAAIVQALEAEGHNQTRAARRLRLSRRAFIYKMEKYGLKLPPGAR
jgi:transcriptional regulator with GAF, ATPase, and Fis domain